LHPYLTALEKKLENSMESLQNSLQKLASGGIWTQLSRHVTRFDAISTLLERHLGGGGGAESVPLVLVSSLDNNKRIGGF